MRLFFCAIAFVPLLVACTGNPSAPLSIGINDSGKQLVLATGSEVILRLPATPSTGYRWQWSPALPEAVHCKELPLAMTQDDLPGAPGEQQWQCQLPEKGRFVLTLDYLRSWEKLPPVRTFNVTLLVR